MGSTPLPALAGLVAACALILALALGLSALAGKALGFNIEDRITLLFCGSKKSLASGIPMARCCSRAMRWAPSCCR